MDLNRYPFPTGESMRQDKNTVEMEHPDTPEPAGTWETIGMEDDLLEVTAPDEGGEVRLQYGVDGTYVEKTVLVHGVYQFVANDGFFGVKPGEMNEDKKREVWVFHPAEAGQETEQAPEQDRSEVFPELPGVALFDLVSLLYMTENLDLHLSIHADEHGFKSMTITRE